VNYGATGDYEMKTNVDSLVKMKVKGEIIHPELWVERGFVTTWDGRPKLTVGIGGIVHNVRVGDPVFGWYADHLNAGVAVSDPDPSKQRGVNVFSCIGNPAKVLTGEAKGAEGVVVGKTYFFAGRSYRLVVDFKPEDRAKLTIGDKIEIEAWGTGLAIEGFEDVRIPSLAPDLLEKIGVIIEDGKLTVPVVKIVPGSIMGTGVGRGGSHAGAWDIQSCSPEINEELGLDSLRFGDLVAVTDVTSEYGNGVFEGGIVVGVVSHGESEIGGHGPGIATIFSGSKERLRPLIDLKANVAYYLRLREDLEW
jgi:hypothetical protein